MRYLFALLFVCGPMTAFADATAVADLCAPCTTGEQCMGNLCALNSSGAGICSQPCQKDADCPSAFACQTGGGVCAPTTAASCPSPYLAGVNTICQFPAASSQDKPYTRDCAAGLICYTNFSADGTTGGVGACVEACSTVSSASACPFGGTCCYATASDSSCVTTSTTASFGGCFDLGDVGDACSDNNRVYCLQGALCQYTQTPTAKYCYDTCDQGLCYEGGTCQKIGSVNLCCAADKWVAGEPTSCVPGPSVCRRAVGVACETNDQCRLGLCYKSGTKAACTAPCSTDADCVAASARGGGQSTDNRCQTFGGSKYCWPSGGPHALPSCATAVVDVTPLTSGGGCHCRAAGQGGSLVSLLFLGSFAARQGWRRRRR